jgi:hypothetical protein
MKRMALKKVEIRDFPHCEIRWPRKKSKAEHSGIVKSIITKPETSFSWLFTKPTNQWDMKTEVLFSLFFTGMTQIILFFDLGQRRFAQWV